MFQQLIKPVFLLIVKCTCLIHELSMDTMLGTISKNILCFTVFNTRCCQGERKSINREKAWVKNKIISLTYLYHSCFYQTTKNSDKTCFPPWKHIACRHNYKQNITSFLHICWSNTIYLWNLMLNQTHQSWP